jgi:peptidoglycan/xylan/chitin deacetylase (PgdA/CDA1 family)
MASNARQKIDGFTRQMFDSEVDKPEHDHILQTLFGDKELRRAILMELHGLAAMPPFDDRSMFDVVDSETRRRSETRLSIDIAERQTGVRPKWLSPSPVRFDHVQLEVLMNYTTDQLGKYERLIGFVDLGVAYHVCGWPHLLSERGKFFWEMPKKHYAAFFEVKSQWPTIGNLIRQLNIYRASRPSFSSDRERVNLVVGPDDSVKAVVESHGYRLVTFDAAGKEFTLHPMSPPAKLPPGVF